MPLLVLGDFYYDYNYIHDDILKFSKYIKENHYDVVVNLEGPITNSVNAIKKRGEHLRQNSIIAEVFSLLNIKGVGLANNHTFDFGVDGLIDTISFLDSIGVKHTGAGLNLSEAKKPMVIDSDEKYYILALTDSFEESIIASNKKPGCAKQLKFPTNPDGKTIVLYHAGFEYNTLPMPSTIKKCRGFVNRGVNCVACSHPHLIQPFEIYKNGLICYSLGNFYFSSFRDEFAAKRIKGKINCYCNFGMGIFFDKAKGIDGEMIIINDKLDASLSSCKENLIIGNPFLYVLKCLKNRNNHNPILLGAHLIDSLLLLVLKIEYFVYGLLRRR